MDDDSVVHLRVKVELDPIVKHICLQLNTWQKSVALSWWWKLFTWTLCLKLLRCNNYWIPVYGVSVLLFQNSMREFFSYRLCAVSKTFLQNQSELQNIGLKWPYHTIDSTPIPLMASPRLYVLLLMHSRIASTVFDPLQFFWRWSNPCEGRFSFQ